MMVIRVIKIITPVKDRFPGFDTYVARPVEGELLRRGRQPWAYNIDRTKNTALYEIFGREDAS
jgi:hypothetical protein